MHATLLSLIIGICAAFAAPYLIPVDAESFVMRSGVFAFSLILLAAGSLTPVLQRRPTLRAWCRAVWPAFLFALALSTGTELFTYGTFLPGIGSALRRLLVPLLITPLFSGLLLLLSSPRSPRSVPGPAAFEMPVYLAVLLLFWLPVLLAYWPGMLNYDFKAEYMQHITGNYSLIHPLSHSVLMNSVISLGERLVDRSFGLLLMSLLQMILLACALTACCTCVRRHGLSRPLTACLLLFFTIHPVFSVMSVSMTKDTLFAASLIALTIRSLDLLEDPDMFFHRKSCIILFILSAAGTALMRNNGLFALVPLLLALWVSNRRTDLRRTSLLTACALLFPLCIHLTLTACLHPVSMPSFQLYSLPAQQLVRAYNTDSLTPDEKTRLENWYVDPEGLVLHPHLADPAKGYLDRNRLETEGADFLSLWRQAASHARKAYLEAFLMLNIGSWYPDDLSHTTIYPDVSYNEKGYLQTQEYDMQDMGFVVTSFLPKLKAVFEQYCRYNRYTKTPLLPILFSTAIPIWVLVVSFTVRRLRGLSISFAPATGAVFLFISYLFGPCTLARYMMPLYALSPVFLLLSLASTGQKSVVSAQVSTTQS